MKRIFTILMLSACLPVSAQKASETVRELKQVEDSLADYSHAMIFAADASSRFYADSVFIRVFVRALKTPYSFSYPFDSIQTVSKIYAPDSSFRIFSWQIQRDESYYRQFGA